MKHAFSAVRFLRTETVKFLNSRGHSVELKAVIQDTLPEGSPIGTVVALHGMPGSHNNFKFVLPHIAGSGVRFICINMPGLGYTENHPDLICDNEERSNFVQSILDSLNISENVVYLGYSRGAQNCLRLGPLDGKRCKGVVMVNPVGLRKHKSSCDLRWVRAVKYFYDSFPATRLFWHNLLEYSFNTVWKVRVPNGTAACSAYFQMLYIAYEQQAEWVEQWNEDNMKDKYLVIAYGETDSVIDTEISQEFCASFSNATRLYIHGKRDQGEQNAIDWVGERIKEGDRKLIVCFKEEDHFLQIDKPRFLAEACLHLLNPQKASSSHA